MLPVDSTPRIVRHHVPKVSQQAKPSSAPINSLSIPRCSMALCPPFAEPERSHACTPVCRSRLNKGPCGHDTVTRTLTPDHEYSLKSNPTLDMMQVLFPYAARRLRAHLEETYDSDETAADVDLLRQLVSASHAACRYRRSKRATVLQTAAAISNIFKAPSFRCFAGPGLHLGLVSLKS